MDTLEIADRLEEVILSGLKIFGGKVVVSGDALREELQKLRLSLPTDLREAKQVLEQREEVVSQAQREAKRVTAAADEEFRAKVQESNVVKAAERRAQEVLGRAEQEAKSLFSDAAKKAQIKTEGANQYTVEVLRNLEIQLTAMLGSIRRGIESLEGEATKAVSGGSQNSS